MIDAAIFLTCLIGFVLLLLAMQRHQQDWFRRKLAPYVSRNMRLSGFALLGGAFVIAGAGFGWGYGAIAWLGWLTIAAALVVMAHCNRERILKGIGR